MPPGFYLDENLGRQHADSLRRAGLDVVRVHERRLEGCGDNVQLLTAATLGGCLVTFDDDFVDLHDAWHNWSREWGVNPTPVHGGIMILPEVNPSQLRQLVTQFLLAERQLPNHVYRWSNESGWERRTGSPPSPFWESV